MTALLEKAWEQVTQLPDAKQDEVAALVLKTLEKKDEEPPEARPQFGSAKGLVWMSPDFEEPLEELGQMKNGPEEPRPYFGSAKGLGRMMPDFEEPLEDFKDYM
ncbi:MAG: DUF2281 domain-containing protein [Armatimonadota bacterium]|nr:DUF2281 domain-containing protein [Armatimonadota bacterium]